MEITFKNIKITNFMNYQKTKNLEFHKGMDLIHGENGVGKSTWNDAIFYALFGKSFRKIKITSLINWEVNKKLLVTIEFDIGSDKYLINRGQKPSKFEIFKNDELIPITSNSKDYQKYLENEILLMNEIVFRQLVVLGSNLPSSKPFMELNQKEKEMVFQTLTDTSIFTDIKVEANARMNILKNEISTLDYKLKTLKEVIKEAEIYHENKLKMIEQNEAMIKDRKNYKAKLSHENSQIIIDIKAMEFNINKIKKSQIKLDKTQKNQMLKEVKKLQEKVNNYSYSAIEEINNLREKNLKEIKELDKSEEFQIIHDKKSKLDKIIEFKSKEISNQEQMQRDIKELNEKIKYSENPKNFLNCSSCGAKNQINSINNPEYKLENLKERLKEAQIKSDESINRYNQIKIKMNSISTEINSLEHELEIKKEHLKKNSITAIENLKDFHKENSKKITKELQTIKTSLMEFSINENKIKSDETTIKKILEDIENKKSKYVLNEKELNSLPNIEKIKCDLSQDSLKDKNKELEKIKLDLDDKNTLKLHLEDIAKMLSGDLKNDVIKSQIPLFNREINYFLSLFSVNSKFLLDEHFNEIILPISSNIDLKDSIEFNSLSNGQKTRITFSIMFSFLKLIELRNSVKTNIMILDEVLDTSVDSDGKEELLNILNTEFHQKNIIIISHSEEIKQRTELFNRIIDIKKPL